MTTHTTPQFWHITFPTKPDDDGLVDYMGVIGIDEQDARWQAIGWSRSNGSATVTNREGLVATYVNGREWHPNQTAAQREAADPVPVVEAYTEYVNDYLAQLQKTRAAQDDRS